MWGREPATEVEKRWQETWDSRGAFDPAAATDRPSSCVLAICPPPKQDVDLTSLRSYVIADTGARFRRSQGEAVRFSVMFDPVDREGAEEPGGGAALAAVQDILKRLGCTCDPSQVVDSADPALSLQTQSLFPSLLEQDLVYESQGQWFLRAAPFLEANQKGLEELSAWSEPALASQQKAAGGGLSGWEVDASILGIGNLPVFTQHVDRIGEAAFIAISPFYPGADSFVSDPEHLARLREQGDLPPLEAGLQASVPGVDDLLPVIVWSAVETRYGPTAVLGIPSAEAEDAEVAGKLRPGSSLGGMKLKSKSSGEPRQTERYRASNIPVSRAEGGSGTALPIVECEKCGSRPLPVGETGSVDSCPECGGPARRAPGSIEPRLTAMWTWLSACTPSELQGQSPWNGTSGWQPPTTQVVASSDAAELLFEQRLGAKVLQRLSVLDQDANEPFQRAVVHEQVEPEAGESGAGDPAPLLDELGADVLRFALLNAAAPRTSFRWTQTPVRRSERFLEELWAYAEPRLRDWGSAEEPEIDPSTRLRRRLQVWIRVAVDKVTASLENLETQRSTHDLVLLLARIRDFEQRAADDDGELDAADRQAVVYSLLVLVRLLSTCAPHISAELWHLAGKSSSVEDAPWPDVSELHPNHASVAQLATAQ